MDICVRKQFSTIIICGAEKWTIIIHFLPSDKVAVLIEGGFLSGSAELVLLAKELVDAENSEHSEDENDEEEHAHQAWNRAEQGLDLLSHRWHFVDGAQWSQDTECSQSL